MGHYEGSISAFVGGPRVTAMLHEGVGHSHAAPKVGEPCVLSAVLTHFVAALADGSASRTRADLLIVMLIGAAKRAFAVGYVRC